MNHTSTWARIVRHVRRTRQHKDTTRLCPCPCHTDDHGPCHQCDRHSTREEPTP